ncbi:hypothetical protein GCM10022254_43170 [Actinomadura meridiana]|uniref:Uncharacterized protein n=1 Tax=Actinomadura meridiana TaxID=559626 RepID=A0ABP8C8G7_9ACTN
MLDRYSTHFINTIDIGKSVAVHVRTVAVDVEIRVAFLSSRTLRTSRHVFTFHSPGLFTWSPLFASLAHDLDGIVHAVPLGKNCQHVFLGSLGAPSA